MNALSSDQERFTSTFDDLFKKAKERDEFEYACTLLRMKGEQSAGWDGLDETRQLVIEMLSLIESPLLPHTRARLALLVYCHILETDAVYEVLMNMLRCIEGERYSLWPLLDLVVKNKKGDVIQPSAKRVMREVRSRAERMGEARLVAMMDDVFDDEVRNAFVHSDYVLHGDEFRVLAGWFTDEQPHVKMRDKLMKMAELQAIVNRGIAYFDSFLHTLAAHIKSYTENKVVPGRIGGGDLLLEVTLLAEASRGLYGFRSSGVPHRRG